MKLWYQSVTRNGRFPAYNAVLRKVINRAKDPSTEVEIHGIERQGGTGDQYRYLAFLQSVEILENVHRAIDEGFDAKNKQALVLGAGGVSTSVILALKNLGIPKITLMNRTKDKALNIKQMFDGIEVREWGEKINFDIVVNCTSLGLNNEEIGIDLNDAKGKIFYDIIYKPKTKFLTNAEKNNKTINGKMMFIYQAQKSFEIWHGVLPKIDQKVIGLIND
mgnify:CR=1 FL=1